LPRYIPVRRHVPVSVASRTQRVRDLLPDVGGPVPDVTEFIPHIVQLARTTNKPIRPRRIPALLHPASRRVSSGDPSWIKPSEHDYPQRERPYKISANGAGKTDFGIEALAVLLGSTNWLMPMSTARLASM